MSHCIERTCPRHAASYGLEAERSDPRRILIVEEDDFQALMIERMFHAFGVKDLLRVSLPADAGEALCAEEDVGLVIWTSSSAAFVGFVQLIPRNQAFPALVLLISDEVPQLAAEIGKRHLAIQALHAPLTLCDVGRICADWKAQNDAHAIPHRRSDQWRVATKTARDLFPDCAP